MRLKVGAATSVGRVRPINEDAYLVRDDQGLCVVCDGMGGSASGEVASRLAVETIAARIASQPVGSGAGGVPPPPPAGGRAGGDQAHAGRGTTVVGVWIDDALASIAHVGDSRAYLFNKSGFEALTSDHSLVEAQVQAGLIDREQSLKSEHQNILLRALGREPDVEVELSETTIAPSDRLLLCTDGLTRMVDDHGLAHALERYAGDPQAACDYLIAAANEQGGPDNITVVIIEVQGSRLSGFFDRFK
jgi:serine/threonine protein phosphatase PrpC